ncbi:hypothetical protein B0O99DRAFT_380831 [Bisporella sp. PMI_857]|nr:hypothetical protein B0O99DRAFT_380831 [Bisporella sp. PMI_857]
MEELQVDVTPREGLGINELSLHTARSNSWGYWSQDVRQTEEQHSSNNFGRSLHPADYIPWQSDASTVRSVLGACQRRRTSRNDQESGQMPFGLTTTPGNTPETRISDKAVEVARGAQEYVLSVSLDEQTIDGSQTISVPPQVRLPTHSPEQANNPENVVYIHNMQQSSNPTLARILDNFQRTCEFSQNSLRDYLQGVEQELKRSQSDIISLERCAAWITIDIENIKEANAGLEAGSMVIEALSRELSDAAQKHAQEMAQLHARVKELEKSVKAVQTIILNMASPC